MEHFLPRGTLKIYALPWQQNLNFNTLITSKHGCDYLNQESQTLIEFSDHCESGLLKR